MYLLFTVSYIAHTVLTHTNIEFEHEDNPVASHPAMKQLMRDLNERSVRRGLSNPSTLTQSDKRVILDLHNDVRSRTARGKIKTKAGSSSKACGMNALRWSDTLAKLATDYAKGCYYEHSEDCESRVTSAEKKGYKAEWQRGSYKNKQGATKSKELMSGCGENLALSGKEPSMDGIKSQIVSAWCENEALAWKWTSDGSRPSGTGHYTAAVWADSRYVGCGFYKCNGASAKDKFRDWGKEYLVCNYYPSGNVKGQYVYEKGSPCSCCAPDRVKCTHDGGLCGGGLSSWAGIKKDWATDEQKATVDLCDDGLGRDICNGGGSTGSSDPDPEPDPEPEPDPPSGGGDCDGGDCIQIEDLRDNAVTGDSYNGQWQYKGCDDSTGYSYYKRSGLFLCYDGSKDRWIITDELCSNSGKEAYCKIYGTDIFDCQSWNVRKSSTTFVRDTDLSLTTCGGGSSDPDPEPDPEPEPEPEPEPDPPSSGNDCDGDSCIRIANIKKDLSGKDYNGLWKSGGCDESGKHYYEHSDFAGFVLCHETANDRWIITKGLCSYSKKKAYCKNHGDDIFDCWKWAVKSSSSSYTIDSDVVISECNGNGAFTLDSDCFGGYPDELCVYSNGTLWNDTLRFEVYDSVCDGTRPMYRHKYYNESNGEAVDIYYLHYAEVEERVLSDEAQGFITETNGQWVINMNQMIPFGHAICYENDLMQCTQNKWKVMIQTNDGNRRVWDRHMTIDYNVCSYESDDKTSSKSVVILMLLLLFLVFVIGAVMGVFFYQKNRNKFMRTKAAIEIEDESDEEIEIDDGDPEEGTTINLNDTLN